MSSDPYMAYWDSLPFQGFHIPDHLKIVGGKVKASDHGMTDRSQQDKAQYDKKRTPVPVWDSETMMNSREVGQLWGIMTWRVDYMVKQGKLEGRVMTISRDGKPNNYRVYDRAYIMSLEPPGKM